MADHRLQPISLMNSAGIKYHLNYLYSIRIGRNTHVVDALIADYTIIYNQKLTKETKRK